VGWRRLQVTDRSIGRIVGPIASRGIPPREAKDDAHYRPGTGAREQ
jgi:hypothetical protein